MYHFIFVMLSDAMFVPRQQNKNVEHKKTSERKSLYFYLICTVAKVGLYQMISFRLYI